ncbi:helix-turn-helix domain-containing protein [Microbacterium sp.]|uniref:helix-turn-helix domain-containing protein n=1 Tax=Microbacterium sp. TaxID=51671 RepID=UPI0039E32D16
MRVRTVRELGGLVRERREALGWSQQALSERAGTSREWIVRLEAGKPGVRMDRVFDVIGALGLVVELEQR